MKSLFNSNDVQELIDRINKITPQSRPLWGKMNAAQLMAHFTAPLKMAHGEIKGKRGLISLLFGKSSKKKFVKPGVDFLKNLPTDPNFIFPNELQFEAEKTKLIDKLNDFCSKGPAGISKDPHSFFGPMTPGELDIIQYKHFDHHLKQFGV